MPVYNNPQLYRELSAPVDRAALEDRLEEFFKELMELRVKHKLPDVHVIIRADVFMGDLIDNEVVPVMTAVHLGDSRMQETMTAWAFGRAGVERSREVDASKASGLRTGRRNREE